MNVQQIKAEICDHYCKFPDQYDDGDQFLVQEIECVNCPLNELEGDEDDTKAS